jgi:hypothetical protein
MCFARLQALCPWAPERAHIALSPAHWAVNSPKQRWNSSYDAGFCAWRESSCPAGHLLPVWGGVMRRTWVPVPARQLLILVIGRWPRGHASSQKPNKALPSPY